MHILFQCRLLFYVQIHTYAARWEDANTKCDLRQATRNQMKSEFNQMIKAKLT